MKIKTQTMQWSTIDKSTWAPGPWHDEPDKMQWQDERTGLACLIVRNEMGKLCGYVGVTSEQPLHGKLYSDEACGDLDAHGGPDVQQRMSTGKRRALGGMGAFDTRTQAGGARSSQGDIGRLINSRALELASYDAWVKWHEAAAVCHVSACDDTWWFGFDCGHYCDKSPGLDAMMGRFGGGLRDLSSVYRDVWYVKDVCASLAQQLATFETMKEQR